MRFWGTKKLARGRGGFVHLAAGTRKSGQWSLVPSYGWGLDYPKSLKLFWEKICCTDMGLAAFFPLRDAPSKEKDAIGTRNR